MRYITTSVCEQKHVGEIKHAIRKHVEWATFWSINKDHSMNVCKDVVKRKEVQIEGGEKG